MPSPLFTSRKCFKTAQKQVYKKKEYGKYLWCVSLFGAVFSDFRDVSTGFPNQYVSLLASTMNLRGRKSITAHVLQTRIHQSLGHCLVYKTAPNICVYLFAHLNMMYIAILSHSHNNDSWMLKRLKDYWNDSATMNPLPDWLKVTWSAINFW